MKHLILLWILFFPFVVASKNLPTANYLLEKPLLDGLLDEALKLLPIRRFENHYRFDNPPIDEVEVSYRLAYTPTHLYLYIETDAKQLNYHKRGYLWGDGFKVLLGKPAKEGIGEEYYELAFSPGDKGYLRKFMTSYNFDGNTRILGEKTNFAEALTDSGSGFEVLIAWSDIYPYHPMFDSNIGINIYFAKGFDTKEHGYFPHGYSIVDDEGIWDEEIAKRAHRTSHIAF